MTLTALLELLQDCCIFQSEHLGIGMDFILILLYKFQDCIGFALLILQRYRHLVFFYADAGIFTWAYECKGFYGYRNFKVVDEQGGVVAYANSIWIYMDTEKMIPGISNPAIPCP